MSSISQDDILEQIKKIDSEIKLRIEYYDTIIDAILKKKESFERAKIVWSTLLSFTPTVPAGTEFKIDREDITERFNSCNQ